MKITDLEEISFIGTFTEWFKILEFVKENNYELVETKTTYFKKKDAR